MCVCEKVALHALKS